MVVGAHNIKTKNKHTNQRIVKSPQRSQETGSIPHPRPTEPGLQNLMKGQQVAGGQPNLRRDDIPEGGHHSRRGGSSGPHELTLTGRQNPQRASPAGLDRTGRNNQEELVS